MIINIFRKNSGNHLYCRRYILPFIGIGLHIVFLIILIVGCSNTIKRPNYYVIEKKYKWLNIDMTSKYIPDKKSECIIIAYINVDLIQKKGRWDLTFDLVNTDNTLDSIRLPKNESIFLIAPIGSYKIMFRGGNRIDEVLRFDARDGQLVNIGKIAMEPGEWKSGEKGWSYLPYKFVIGPYPDAFDRFIRSNQEIYNIYKNNIIYFPFCYKSPCIQKIQTSYYIATH